ncbi:MAG: amidohydrolase family protein [Thermodesulfovibrionales bacterium]|nr:amidohydrolase family protein [Thermodesulfovibrionales bacterium]
MNHIIDFHTHAFPDSLYIRAMSKLTEHATVKAYLDGSLTSLLKSMDTAGISKSVLCNIATRSGQFQSIISWCKEIQSQRIIPLPSIHPADEQWDRRISEIANEGFKGIKLHPYYQDFVIDAKEMIPIYKRLAQEDLFLVMHTGFDIAFDRIRIADPIKVINLLNEVPDLKLITTHFGGWDDWEEVDKHIIGRKIYMEISFSLEILDNKVAESMIMRHPSEYILFGTDSPWTDQIQAVNKVKSLNIPDFIKEKITYKNALRLLHLS